MNKLTLAYEALPYPYPEDAVFNEMRWGQISLFLVDDLGEVVKKIVDTQWDITPFLEWILDNRERICNDNIPIDSSEDSSISIAEIIYRFFDTNSNIDDDLIDKLYEYRESHDIRFGMRGTDITSVYIAKNGLSMELSFFSEKDSWSHSIDIGGFLEEAQTIRDTLLN